KCLSCRCRLEIRDLNSFPTRRSSDLKRFIRNSRNNVYELLSNNKYTNSKLDIGFKSENQTIWIDNKGVHTENPLLKKIGNYVNVDYINYEADKDLFNSEEYSQVEAFLTHISDGCYRDRKSTRLNSN